MSALLFLVQHKMSHCLTQQLVAEEEVLLVEATLVTLVVIIMVEVVIIMVEVVTNMEQALAWVGVEMSGATLRQTLATQARALLKPT